MDFKKPPKQGITGIIRGLLQKILHPNNINDLAFMEFPEQGICTAGHRR